jgi:excisionase family DNA binding protein
MKMKDGTLLNTNELARVIGVNRCTVRQWRKLRAIPSLRLGGRYYYRLESVKKALEKKEVKAR